MSDRPDNPPAAPDITPAWRNRWCVAWFGILALALLAADLVVKSWSFRTVAGEPVINIEESAVDHAGFWSRHMHEPVVVIPHVLSLRLTTNTGAVFGLGKGSQWFFALASMAATGFILWMFARSPARAFWLHTALAMVLSGALGNLYDRVRYRAVRDMFYLFPGIHLPFGWSWSPGVTEVYPWIFNIADAALVVGVGLLVILMWKYDTRPRNAGSTQH